MTPYLKEHSARLQSPSKYVKFRRKNDTFSEGIDVIYGITDSGNAEVQALRFDAGYFTAKQAQKWLNRHEYNVKKFEPAVAENPRSSIVQQLSELDKKLSKNSNWNEAVGDAFDLTGTSNFEDLFKQDAELAASLVRSFQHKTNPKTSKSFTKRVFFRIIDSYGHFIVQIGDKVYEGEASPYLLNKLKFMLSKEAFGRVVQALKKYITNEITEKDIEQESKKFLRSNPPRNAELIYDEVLSIEALKGEDSLFPNQHFRHDFDSHPKMFGLPDGSILITHDDKAAQKKNPLWANVSGYKKGADY